MRIVHVVPVMSPTMHFGGPVRVALNEATESIHQGSTAEMVGGGIEMSRKVRSYFGVPARAYGTCRLLPFGRFLLLASPGLWLSLISRDRNGADIFHVHLGRDLLTTISCLILARRGIPYVVQTHGMIEPRESALVAVWDFLLTRRALQKAEVALALTPSELAEVDRLARRRIAQLFENAVAVNDVQATRGATRVLFLARLHPRKGAEQFARVAVSLATRFPSIEFVIAGPDEGGLRGVVEVLGPANLPNVEYVGAVEPDNVADEMKRASIYVLPARAEPFGMTILESLAAGTPVILHETAALATDLREAGAALTFDGSDTDLYATVAKLITNEEVRGRMSIAGREHMARRYGIQKSVTELLALYRDVLKVRSSRKNTRIL